MKNCVNCGAEIEDQNKFCPHCGTSCENGQEIVSSESTPIESVPEVQNEPGPQSNPHSMKWHNFLMVTMIIGGILTILNGVNTMMGSEYISVGYDSAQVYRAFPGLKSCDIFYGIAMIALGVYEFIVRSRLNNFRINAPTSLKIMFVLSIMANLIYLAWASSVTGTSLFNSSNIGSLLVSVLFLIINSVYYSRRSELFVY